MCKNKTHRQNQEPLKNKELAEAEIKMDIDYFSGSTLLFPFYKVTYKVISIISYFLLALRVPTRGTQKEDSSPNVKTLIITINVLQFSFKIWSLMKLDVP